VSFNRPKKSNCSVCKVNTQHEKRGRRNTIWEKMATNRGP